MGVLLLVAGFGLVAALLFAFRLGETLAERDAELFADYAAGVHAAAIDDYQAKLARLRARLEIAHEHRDWWRARFHAQRHEHIV